MTDRLPTSEITETGMTYTCPHLSALAPPPYDLTEATDWEAQQITHYWRNAVKAAEQIHRVAHHALVDLYTEMNDVGDNRPQHLTRDALDLAVAVSALRGVHNGMRHRIAMVDAELGI